MTAFDVARCRKDFPILARTANGCPLVYLDSANTSQKPQSVIDAVSAHYACHNANVARAMHALGMEATAAYEGARAKVAAFIGAQPEEIVFTKNASEALNLAANCLGAALGPGDEIVTTVAEHHSNIVPWQLVSQRSGAKLRWFDVTDEGRLDLARAAAGNLINERTKVVAVTWLSNVTGAVSPLPEIIAWARAVGAAVVVDGSQGVPHRPADVAALGADCLAFTGHKMLGPTGIGVLWGRSDVLAGWPPFLGGGEMIETVRMTGSSYARPPHRFEAGTPPIAQAVGLAAAIDYLNACGLEAVEAWEAKLTAYLLERLAEFPEVTVLGPTTMADRGSAVSFTLADIHPHDAMQILDADGVAVRGGHHCARPLHERFGVPASIRVSPYLYTTEDEIDRLADSLLRALRFFRVRPGGRG
ncbi:MAG: SufS family cysteine desulfurase [Propionibacteriaceae bacterium]|jgi:cysteine desulfurase/selenocysteine lyase|nr:SufS family cysteine desulfurase [Propionibacteriaceae bacterium]